MSVPAQINQAAAALTYREDVRAEDVARIRAIVTAAANFSGEEIDIAAELAEERLARGPASGYEFIFAERDGVVQGYACYGLIPGTVARYDLYWVAVDPQAQRYRIGAELVRRVETAVRERGGERIYIDTSTSEAYAPARGFYTRMGYRRAAELPDFYKAGDGKIIFLKVL